eukprot:CAMPEP_0174256150 /NCGR_PEP_ID=MMETSP0439-20130205/5388_1 /TAXON_ID=0 /ORGANISM="Stereomyxa ramosa, Strain Chinc5" /LENGTH=271 /DNA_ID=CAMNT_0015338631 /DNA_START=128 /DNA_END=943 /DNA_ORIENTATION=-
MGDTCCNPLSLGRLQKLIEETLPGIYVYSIEIGPNQLEDQIAGFLGNSNSQIEGVCEKLRSDPKLANGFNAVGFSQGAQFLRGYVERCNLPKVHNLVSIGGQHQGVFGFPRCPGENSTLCEFVRKMLDLGAYLSFVQDSIIQAQYWHDPTQQAAYLKDCILIPDLNNAHDKKNQTYKDNMVSLNNFVMVKFTEDTMVQPRESEWFGFYKQGQDKETVTLQETDLYQQDWIGLKQLDGEGKLKFLSVVGDHLRFSEEWFVKSIVTPYFNVTF